MATISEIKNASLLKLGVKPVDDFLVETTNEAKICNRLYPLYKRNMLSRRRWSFAMKRIKLASFSNVVEDEFKYAFDLPADFINLVSVFIDDKYQIAFPDYEMRGNKIYTNEGVLFIKYIYDAPEEQFSGVFTDFFTVAFASEICWVLTGDKVLTDFIKNQAFGGAYDNMRGGLFGVASLSDSAQNPTRRINPSSVFTRRHGGI